MDRKYFLKDLGSDPCNNPDFGFPSHRSSGCCLSLVPLPQPPVNPPRTLCGTRTRSGVKTLVQGHSCTALFMGFFHMVTDSRCVLAPEPREPGPAPPWSLLIPCLLAQGSQNRFCSMPETAQANFWAGKDPLACLQVILQPDPFPGPVPCSDTCQPAQQS